MEKLKYKVLRDYEFSTEDDFLDTILKAAGVENVKEFLNVRKGHTHDPFLLKNIKEGIELLHNSIGKGKKVYLQVDCDVDGYTSSSYIYQFIKEIAPDTEIVYGMHYKKEHGIFFTDIEKIEGLDLIIVPDAGSDSIEDCKQIKKVMKVPVLIIDHHEIVKEIYKYATLVNCTDGVYPNRNLSGVGVVHKFCLAYCEQYELPIETCDRYLDLVSLGMIADSIDMRDLETRYYTLEGLKDENKHNSFINEIAERFAEDMKLGHTITSYGWVIAPKINAVVRYGKEQEQIDLFRAFIGEFDDTVYQPRRKVKTDPKPETEIHSLQKTMARVASNVKQRQDTQVRNFMVKLDRKIVDEKLDKDSVIILDAGEILTVKSVSGLVANKLMDKYKRPIVILKPMSTELGDKDDENEVFADDGSKVLVKDTATLLAEEDAKIERFGGSARGFESEAIPDFRQFLLDLNLFDKCAGHPMAFGIELKKENVQIARDKCNSLVNIDDLVTIHEVDYSIKAKNLTSKGIVDVANAYQVWGNKVSEPTFAITDIDITGADILAFGENNGFVKFKYKDIGFIKKYCKKGVYEDISLKDRNTLGENTKPLKLTIIGTFVFNEYQGVRYPQINIKKYYTEERFEKASVDMDIDDIF